MEEASQTYDKKCPLRGLPFRAATAHVARPCGLAQRCMPQGSFCNCRLLRERAGRNTNSFLISFHLRRQSIVEEWSEPPLLLSAKYKQNRKKYWGKRERGSPTASVIVMSKCISDVRARKEAGQKSGLEAFSLGSLVCLPPSLPLLPLPFHQISASFFLSSFLPSIPFSCP